MKASLLIPATLMGLTVYLLLEVIFGQYGIIAYHRLDDFRDRSVLELAEIKDQTRVLQRQVRLLTTDRETVRLEARDIGFVATDEMVLRVQNRDPRLRHRYQPGALPSRFPQVRDNRPLFRSVGFAVFLLTLLFDLSAWGRLRAAPGRRYGARSTGGKTAGDRDRDAADPDAADDEATVSSHTSARHSR